MEEMKFFHKIFSPHFNGGEKDTKGHKLDLIQRLLDQRKGFRMAVLYGVIILIKGKMAPAEFIATFQSLNQNVLYVMKKAYTSPNQNNSGKDKSISICVASLRKVFRF